MKYQLNVYLQTVLWISRCRLFQTEQELNLLHMLTLVVKWDNPLNLAEISRKREEAQITKGLTRSYRRQKQRMFRADLGSFYQPISKPSSLLSRLLRLAAIYGLVSMSSA